MCRCPDQRRCENSFSNVGICTKYLVDPQVPIQERHWGRRLSFVGLREVASVGKVGEFIWVIEIVVLAK